jgi:hypothetical protein
MGTEALLQRAETSSSSWASRRALLRISGESLPSILKMGATLFQMLVPVISDWFPAAGLPAVAGMASNPLLSTAVNITQPIHFVLSMILLSYLSDLKLEG